MQKSKKAFIKAKKSKSVFKSKNFKKQKRLFKRKKLHSYNKNGARGIVVAPVRQKE